ncbi:MAG TPA: FAD-dependent oxidoreductase [Longimicrobium sp.]
MSPLPDVAVVGAGVMGASVAFHLAAAGARVLVLERGRPGAGGATGASGGLVRMNHPHPGVAALAWESHRVFEEWGDRVGGCCGYRRTGFALLAGPGGAAELAARAARLRGMGIAVLLLDARALCQLQPYLSPAGIGAAAFEPFSGHADPARAARALLRAARARGAQVRPFAAAAVRAGPRGASVHGAAGEVRAGAVVVAAGCGTRRLLAGAGVRLPLRPRRIGLCRAAWRPAEGEAPLCTFVDETTGTYFRPAAEGVLLGVRTGGPARRGSAPPTAAEVRAAGARLARRIPAAAGAALEEARTGVDAYTPDALPLIGPVPGSPALYVVAGFSGTGFKLAPAVGRLAAGELLESRAPELHPFRPERFAGGVPVPAAA